MTNFENPTKEFNYSTIDKVDGTIQDKIDNKTLTMRQLTSTKLQHLQADIDDNINSYLRIRDDNGKVIGKLNENKDVDFIDKKEVSTKKGKKVFLKIKTGDITGWVSADYMKANTGNTTSIKKSIQKKPIKKEEKDTSEVIIEEEIKEENSKQNEETKSVATKTQNKEIKKKENIEKGEEEKKEKPIKEVKEQEIFNLSGEKLKSAITFYNKVGKNNTWKKTLGNSLDLNGIKIKDFSIENLAKGFAELQEQNGKIPDGKAWNDLTLLNISKDFYTVKTKKEKTREHNSKKKKTQSLNRNIKNIPDGTKSTKINKARISELEQERSDLKDQMDSIKNQIKAQYYNGSNTGIILGGQHYGNSYSGGASLEEKYNVLVREYNNLGDEINTLKGI